MQYFEGSLITFSKGEQQLDPMQENVRTTTKKKKENVRTTTTKKKKNKKNFYLMPLNIYTFQFQLQIFCNPREQS